MNIEKGHHVPLARRKELGIKWESIEHGDSVVVEDKAEVNYVTKSFNRIKTAFPALGLTRFKTRQQTFKDPETKLPLIRVFFIDQDKETDDQIADIKRRLKIRDGG
jgi:hypothetical protein